MPLYEGPHGWVINETPLIAWEHRRCRFGSCHYHGWIFAFCVQVKTFFVLSTICVFCMYSAGKNSMLSVALYGRRTFIFCLNHKQVGCRIVICASWHIKFPLTYNNEERRSLSVTCLTEWPFEGIAYLSRNFQYWIHITKHMNRYNCIGY